MGKETVDGKSYPRWDDVVKIVPDYWWLFVSVMIIAGLLLIAFDAVMLLRYLIIKKSKGGNIPDENEEKTQS